MSSPAPNYRVLFVTRVIPIANSTGARSYVFDFLTYLKSKAFNLELACVDASPGGRSPILFLPSVLRNLCDLSFRNHIHLNRVVFRLKSLLDLAAMPFGLVYHLLPEKKRSEFINTCVSLASMIFNKTGNRFEKFVHHPSVKNYPATSMECQFVRDRIDQFRPDIIIANYAWLAQVFDSISDHDNILKIVLAHDVIHQRYSIAQKLGIQWGDYPWTCEEETSLLNKADLILTIQKEDSTTIQQLLPNSKVLCMPMAARPNQHNSSQIRGRCLFVGSKGYANDNGLQWYLNEVWPCVLKLAPHSQLHVCGTVCGEIKGEHERVHFLGRVENLAIEYGQAEVCLAPLLFGTGLKIKIIEALSYGRACVATDSGLQGLSDLAGKAILRANSAEEFAEAVARVLNSESVRCKLEAGAKRYIKNSLSPEKVYQPVVDLINRHMLPKTQSPFNQEN